MTSQEERERQQRQAEEERLYWQKIGYMAKSFGLEPTVSDVDVLNHERMQRAEKQGLDPEATWFQVYCAELRAGLQPTTPDYFDSENMVDWEDRPNDAFMAAEQAAQIFLKK